MSTAISPAVASTDVRPAAIEGIAASDTDSLKRRTVRGAAVSGVSQAAAFVLRTGSLLVMARLLFPRDFGLFAMAGAFTGFLQLFRDLGLSMASVTRPSVTEQQLSTLFWVNVVVGLVLAALCAAAAPLMVRLYGEPHLFWITIWLGTGFVFNGVAAQHRALLQRHMRFGVLAIIDTMGLTIGILVSIAMAALGYGYWALVVMAISPQAISGLGAWISTGWIPGQPQRHSEVRSMLLYGGTVTINNVVVYVAYNVDKILLGWWWGADVLGIYGRAYQLVNLPTDNLNGMVSQVAIPALSRVQDDELRLRSYFLQGYSLFLALVVPITVACALFGDDIIDVFLGTRWHDAAGVFKLLTPMVLVFAIVNPLAWLMLATGRSTRSLKIALLIAPAAIVGYALGLPSGSHGVAAGFSAAMSILVIPVVLWAIHGTPVTVRDLLTAVAPSLGSIAASAVAALALSSFIARIDHVFLRLVGESSLLFGVYFLLMLFVFGQKAHYIRILRETGLWPAAGLSRRVAGAPS